MSSEIITQETVAQIDWHDDCYLYCIFRDFEIRPSEIHSIFNGCSFANLDWYGGLFNCCTLIGCTFENCLFQGTAFADCKFVECSFTNCRFVKNNMDSDCHFNGSVAYACTFDRNEGCNIATG